MDEVLTKIEGIRSDWELFKTENNKRLDQLATKGHVDSLLAEKVGKIDVSIETALTELRAKQNDVDAKLNRINTEFEERGQDKVELARWATHFGRECSTLRKRKVTFNRQELAAYMGAFDEYLRVGKEGLAPQARTVLEVGSDPGGGYRVSPDVSGRMVQLIYETSPMRQICAVQRISGDALEGPRDLNEASCGWVGERETRAATNTPDLGEYRIPCHEVYAMPAAYQRMLDDAEYDPASWLIKKAVAKMVRTENAAFVTGTGAKRPRGFTTHTASTSAPTAATYEVLQYVATGVSGAFGHDSPNSGAGKLVDLVFKLKAAFRANARWLSARATLAKARQLRDENDEYIWLPDFSANVTLGKLLGFPVVEAEDMPVIAADSLSLALGDFREGYQIVDKAGVSLLRDPFTTKGQVKFYMTRRVGGDTLDFDAIKALKFGTS